MILLVEDDPSDREAYADALAPLGVPVRVATRGEDALRMLEEKTPVCVITDWRMPGIDGRDIVLAMRQTPEWEDIPVVVLSGLEERTVLAQVAPLHINVYMQKPVDLDLFVLQVRRLVRAP